MNARGLLFACACCLPLNSGLAAEEVTDCMETTGSSQPESLAYMPNAKLDEPMKSEMGKPGMVKSDVAIEASKNERCLSKMMDREAKPKSQ